MWQDVQEESKEAEERHATPIECGVHSEADVMAAEGLGRPWSPRSPLSAPIRWPSRRPNRRTLAQNKQDPADCPRADWLTED